MKNLWIISALALLLLTACIFTPSDENLPGDVFFLTDFDGNPTTTFKTGESFCMNFYLVNSTDDSLDYSYTSPKVSFTIYKGISRVIGSWDGLVFGQLVVDDKLAPGDTLLGLWLAPTPGHWSSIKTLSPGDYKAVATFPDIPELQTDTISAINFIVTE